MYVLCSFTSRVFKDYDIYAFDIINYITDKRSFNHTS